MSFANNITRSKFAILMEQKHSKKLSNTVMNNKVCRPFNQILAQGLKIQAKN